MSVSDDQLDQIYARHLPVIAEELAAAPRATVAVATPSSRGIGVPARKLALLGVLVGLIVALAWTMAIVGQSPSPAMTFPAGSIAFARGADLYVANPDGTGAAVIAAKVFDQGPGSSSPFGPTRRFAFSPDRTSLAYTRVIDTASGARELVVVNPAGDVVGTYRGAASPDPTLDTIFGWSPDGQRLAVYPGGSLDEVAIVGRDGSPMTQLPLHDLEVRAFGWTTLPWSPDAAWIAVPTGGATCTGNTAQAPCYTLLATDGSGPKAISDQVSPADAVWAPDGNITLAHWGPSVGYLGSVASVETRPVQSQPYWIAPLPEHISTVAGHTLSWSPDGKALAIAAADDRLGPVIFVDDPDGQTLRVPLNPMVGVSSFPMITWSPDGERLIFAASSNDGEDISIWSAPVDGGSPTHLVDANGPLFDVAGAGLKTIESTTDEVRPS